MIKPPSTDFSHKNLVQASRTLSNKPGVVVKALVSILLLVTVFGVMGLRTHATADYTNFQQGPLVLSGGASGSSDENIREKLEMKNISSSDSVDFWLGFYTGHFGSNQITSAIHAVISKDGINLHKLGSVIDRADHQDQDPTFVVSNNAIHLYVEVDDNHIDLFTSPAAGALNFTFVGTVIANAASPVVWIEGNTWYMLYETMNAGIKAIHLATSSDGMNWSDSPANPVKIEADDTVPDSIVKDASGVYHMYYHYRASANPETWPAMHATSSDLVSWSPGEQVLPDNWSSPAAVLTQSGELWMYAWNLNGDKNVYLFESVAPEPDTTPPVRANGSPSGMLPQGTTQTAITLDTDEDATCRYATTPGVDYTSMPNIFDTTGGRTHSSLINGLSDGATFSYYVRCEDTVGNQNPDDFLIEFAVSDQPGPAGLIAHWTFDEGSGTTAFDSAGTQHGTLTNMDPATDWIPGKIGTALDFDGTNDLVLVSDSSTLDLTVFTFAHWVKSTVPGGVGVTRQTLSKGDQNYNFAWTHPSNVFDKACAFYDTTHRWRSSGPVSQQLDANTWYHIACVYDGKDLIAYVNGVEGARATINQTPTTNNDSLSIGSGIWNGIGESPFSGAIDDVRVYNRALNESEINQVFQGN